MWPPPRAFMIGRAACVAYIRPRTLVCIMRRQSSVSASRIGPSSITPGVVDQDVQRRPSGRWPSTIMSRASSSSRHVGDDRERLPRRSPRCARPAPPAGPRAARRWRPARPPPPARAPSPRRCPTRRPSRPPTFPSNRPAMCVLSFSVSCSVVLCAHAGGFLIPAAVAILPRDCLPQMGAGMSTQERTKRDGRDAPSQDGQGDGSGPALDEQEKGQVEERLRASALVVHEVIRRAGEEDLGRTPAALAWSGLAAGLSMGFSLVAEGLLRARAAGRALAPAGRQARLQRRVRGRGARAPAALHGEHADADPAAAQQPRRQDAGARAAPVGDGAGDQPARGAGLRLRSSGTRTCSGRTSGTRSRRSAGRR